MLGITGAFARCEESIIDPASFVHKSRGEYRVENENPSDAIVIDVSWSPVRLDRLIRLALRGINEP